MVLRVCLVLAILTLGGVATARPITIDVDARDMPRRLVRARLTMPVKAGKVVIKYPKWIPGEHAPSGPIDHLSKIVFSAGGKPVTWTRDPIDLYAFTVDVPQGATDLVADLEMVLPSSGAFSGGGSATPRLGVLSWNHILLYPDGAKSSDDLRYRPTLTVPKGWKVGSALAIAKSGDRTEFEETSLTALVDSPVLAGLYMREHELAKSPKVRVVIAADSEGALAVPDAQLASYKRLVTEAAALFGTKHYRSYTFLLTLSDGVAHFGLEHHESSDNRLPERMFLDEDKRGSVGLLLAHEYVHSWNGKYRRPAGLQAGRFDVPMNDELLWVYEGLTEYLGMVLAARAGVHSPEYFRSRFATDITRLEGGRSWRPLVDTAVSAQQIYGDPSGWPSRARSLDYYPEGAQFWLEVDATIRDKTKNAKSLDDFCKAFLAGKDSGPEVASYTLDDVIAALDSVVKNDWRGLIQKRVYQVRAKTPSEGVEAAGWSVTYVPTITPSVKQTEATWGVFLEAWSIGLVLNKDAGVGDVVPGSPADRAGIVPGTKLLAVNTRAYSLTRLREAIAKKGPLELIGQQGDRFFTVTLDGKAGARYPDLARNKSTDYLTPILSAKSKP